MKGNQASFGARSPAFLVVEMRFGEGSVGGKFRAVGNVIIRGQSCVLRPETVKWYRHGRECPAMRNEPWKEEPI